MNEVIPGILIKPALGGLEVWKAGVEHTFTSIYALELARSIEHPAKLIVKVSGSADTVEAAREYVRLATLLGTPTEVNVLRQVTSAGTFEHVMLLPGRHQWPNWTVTVRQEIEQVGPVTAWARHYLDVRLPDYQNAITAAKSFVALCEYLEVKAYVTEMGLE